jgi:hypothetical protein
MFKAIKFSLALVLFTQACTTTTSINNMEAEKQVYNISQQKDQYSESLRRALDGAKLSVEETSSVLNECIEIGAKKKDYILRLISQGYTNPIIILGNSGCGKSTTINWLYGCTMVKGRSNNKEVITVRPLSNGGAKDPITPIGHIRDRSETFIPIVAPADNGIVFIDCPGFLESRNQAISIANNINLKNLLNALDHFRILLFVDFPSLNSARSKSTTEMLKLLMPFFGGEEKLLQHKRSMAIGITKLNSFNNEGLSSVKKLVDYLKSDSQDNDSVEYIEEESITEEFEELVIDDIELNEKLDHKNFFSHFASRIFTFDPLGKNIKGGLAKDALLSYMIGNIKPFQRNASTKFITPLTAEDDLALSEISEMTRIKIMNKLKMKQKDYIPTLPEMSEAALLVKSVERFKIIDNPKIEDLLDKIYHAVNYKLLGIEGIIKYKYSTSEEFTEADQLLQNLNLAVISFATQNDNKEDMTKITEGVNIPELTALGIKIKEKCAVEKKKREEERETIRKLNASHSELRTQFELLNKKEEDNRKFYLDNINKEKEDNKRQRETMQECFNSTLKSEREKIQSVFDKESANREFDNYRNSIISGLSHMIQNVKNISINNLHWLIIASGKSAQFSTYIKHLEETLSHIKNNTGVDFCQVECDDNTYMHDIAIGVSGGFRANYKFSGSEKNKKNWTIICWGNRARYSSFKSYGNDYLL